MSKALIDYTYSTGDLWVGKGERRYYFTEEQRKNLKIKPCYIYQGLYLVFYKAKPLCLLQDDRANNKNAWTIAKYIAGEFGPSQNDLEIIADEVEYASRR